jgi:hypothetical protein
MLAVRVKHHLSLDQALPMRRAAAQIAAVQAQQTQVMAAAAARAELLVVMEAQVLL